MKKLIVGLLILIGTATSHSQEIIGNEFGIDGTFYASTNNGSFSVGAKYGFKTDSSFIFGPSLRYQRSWTNNATTGFQSSFNIFGGGAFIHARFFNYFFAGAEFEMFNSPYTDFGGFSFTKKWVPTFLLGGGLSMSLSESVRINFGMMYDILDRPASPLKTQYFVRTENNILLPIIYRFAFFFEI